MLVQSLGQEDPLKENMATFSSIRAWRRIPRTEEPGSLQPIGLQTVGHNWSNCVWASHMLECKAIATVLVSSLCRLLGTCTSRIVCLELSPLPFLQLCPVWRESSKTHGKSLVSEKENLHRSAGFTTSKIYNEIIHNLSALHLCPDLYYSVGFLQL